MPNSVVQEGGALCNKGDKRDSSPNTKIVNTTEQPSENKQKEKQKKLEEQKQSEPNNGSGLENTPPPSNDENTGEDPVNNG